MSDVKLPSLLAAQPEDIQLMLAAQCHIGSKNCDKSMENYVWKRRADGEWRVSFTRFSQREKRSVRGVWEIEIGSIEKYGFANKTFIWRDWNGIMFRLGSKDRLDSGKLHAGKKRP